MLKRPSFVCAAISVIVTNVSGSRLVIVIVSLLSRLSPKFLTCPGLSMNGSVFVPLPLTKLGLDLVFSGSGPFLIPIITNRESPLSLDKYISGIINRSSNNRQQNVAGHKMLDELLSLSESLFPFSGISVSFSESLVSSRETTQFPSASISVGILVELSGSDSHLTSSSSDQVSPSSSVSSLSPVPSLSVSSHSSLSSGNTSSASANPSPSVSSSNASQVLSPLVSVGTSELSRGSVPHIDSS